MATTHAVRQNSRVAPSGVDSVGCPPPVARVAAEESSSAAPRGRSRYVFADMDDPKPRRVQCSFAT